MKPGKQALNLCGERLHFDDIRSLKETRKGKKMTRHNKQDNSKATRLGELWSKAWTARFNTIAGNQKDELVSALSRAAHNQPLTVDEQKMLDAFLVKWFDVPDVVWPA